VGLIIFYGLRPSATAILLLAFVSICFALSFFNGTYLNYKLLSLFYVIPFLLLFFALPPSSSNYGYLLKYFIISTAMIALLNDLVGFVQVAENPKSDDSFLGLYSQYSISLIGLTLINNVLFMYFFTLGFYRKSITLIAIAMFFLLCFVLGFYGAGLIVAVIAFTLTFLRFKLISLLKTIGIALGVCVLVYVSMRILKPDALEYNVNNLRIIFNSTLENGPRKLTAFYNYAVSYPHDLKDFLFGSGPGTFNSRSAFMVGSPSYFQAVQFIKSPHQPYYFRDYAYTLWNEKNTVQALYLDGFRNQPFSSVLAFLGEYGLLFTLALVLLYYSYYKRVAGIYSGLKGNVAAEATFRFFKYLIILLPMLLLIDNFVEYPEIMILIALGIKFSHSWLVHLARQSPPMVHQ
jgi:hypothetical protein